MVQCHVSTSPCAAMCAHGPINKPSTEPDRAALHPLRRAAPVTSRCTRYVALHPIRRGVMPTDRVHRLPQQAQPRAIPPHRPQPQHRTQPHILETRGNAAQRRLKRRLATEKHAPATRPLTAALISCLGTAPPKPLEEPTETLELDRGSSNLEGMVT